MKRMAIEKMKE